jgi:NSS family neurotransmitter:Na+ symporter
MAAHSQRFSSSLTTLLSMAGLAIGLGNVWRFPYMMGQNGGSAFLMVYLLLMLLLAVPALMAEWTLGRATRQGPVAALQAAIGPRAGLLFGLAFLFATFMAACYYSVVIANVLFSSAFAAVHGFNAGSMGAYQQWLANPGLQYGFGLAMLLTCLWLVGRGLQKGIEAANKALVPFFALASLYLVVVTLNLDGAVDQLKLFLRPDFSAVGPAVWFAAMGQACFSVGLSGTICVMYGSYLRREAPLAGTATATCAVDVGAAFLAALFVVPAVLVFGLDMAAGPGLLFDTLPRLFAVMPGGRWLAPLFLLGWALVAMLTIIAVIDTIVGALDDLTGPALTRVRLLKLVGVALCTVMLPIAFNPQWIGTLDMVFGSGMFMLGALVAVLAVGWGLGKATVAQQLAGGMHPKLVPVLVFWVRYVVPTALAAILVGFLYSTLG